MNCDGVRGLLSAYVDGELSAGELLRVEQHLRRCHWCADEVDALRQTIALVASLEEVEVPPTFHARLHARLMALDPPVKAAPAAPVHLFRRPGFRRWAVPAAAAAALVIGVAGLHRASQPAPNPGAVAVSEQGTPGDRTNGGFEVAGINPVDQGSQGAQSEPPSHSDTSAQGGGSADQPAVQPPHGEKPPVNPTGVEEELPEIPPGQTNPNSPLHVATASFLTDIEGPTSLPTQWQYSSTLTASVAEPASVAATLKERFGEDAVVGSPDPVSGAVTVQITVDSRRYQEALAFVQRQTGAEVVDTSVNLASQIEEAYEALTYLDQQREEIDKALQGVTDPQQLELGKASLADLTRKAEAAREDYTKLTNLVARGTIEVILKPLGR